MSPEATFAQVEPADPQSAGISRGPLAGVRVVELAGIGPVPYAAMLLADMGADVLRVDRPGDPQSVIPPETDVLRRNRRSVVLDLRQPQAVRALRRLASRADVLLEGFRPGVVERLGVGPEQCFEENPRLVYGRMTGWGQDGPLAATAGHDIDYLAITGALHAIGRFGGPPTPPLNLLGDFGSGSTFLVMGVLAALWEAGRSGRGQIVDAAIVDGACSITSFLHGMLASHLWSDERGVNLLDTGAPWYDTYATADGKWMAVGAIEPKFFVELLAKLGLPARADDRADRESWPALRQELADAFVARTQAQWIETFAGSDACVAPVLSLLEAPTHPHLVARQTFIEVGGLPQPAPAPRFSRTPTVNPAPPESPGASTKAMLTEWGVANVDLLLASGAAVQL